MKCSSKALIKNSREVAESITFGSFQLARVCKTIREEIRGRVAEVAHHHTGVAVVWKLKGFALEGEKFAPSWKRLYLPAFTSVGTIERLIMEMCRGHGLLMEECRIPQAHYGSPPLQVLMEGTQIEVDLAYSNRAMQLFSPRVDFWFGRVDGRWRLIDGMIEMTRTLISGSEASYSENEEDS